MLCCSSFTVKSACVNPASLVELPRSHGFAWLCLSDRPHHNQLRWYRVCRLRACGHAVCCCGTIPYSAALVWAWTDKLLLPCGRWRRCQALCDLPQHTAAQLHAADCHVSSPAASPVNVPPAQVIAVLMGPAIPLPAAAWAAFAPMSIPAFQGRAGTMHAPVAGVQAYATAVCPCLQSYVKSFADTVMLQSHAAAEWHCVTSCRCTRSACFVARIGPLPCAAQHCCSRPHPCCT